jgi:dihydrodipicolinate synthase/N-acetylneuraminate lyase
VYPAICTPFTTDDAVDLGAQRRVVRFVLESGSHGIVAFGLAGEVLKLSTDERRQLIDVIVDEAGGAVPVFAGVGAPSVRASIELARYAERAGASCVVLPAPAGGAGSDSSLIDYFARVAAAVSVPVMIQDAPQYLGVRLGPEIVRQAGKASENIRLVKLEAGPAEMSEWLDVLGSDFSVWGGDGGVYLLDCVRLGASGIIPGSDLVDRLVDVYEINAVGDEDRADTLFQRILPMLVFEMQHSIDHYNACAKLVLRQRGVLAEVQLRQPAASLPPASRALLERHIAALNLADVGAHADP